MIRLIKFGLTAALLSWAGSASALCTVSTTPITFVNYDVFSPAPLNTTATVTVSCDQAPPVDVTLSLGPSPTAGGFIPRMMRPAFGPDRMNYNIYTDAAGTVIFGDGTGGTSTIFLKNVKKTSPVSVTLYGIIPPLQDLAIGSYGENLTLTFTP